MPISRKHGNKRVWEIHLVGEDELIGARVSFLCSFSYLFWNSLLLLLLLFLLNLCKSLCLIDEVEWWWGTILREWRVRNDGSFSDEWLWERWRLMNGICDDFFERESICDWEVMMNVINGRKLGNDWRESRVVEWRWKLIREIHVK